MGQLGCGRGESDEKNEGRKKLVEKTGKTRTTGAKQKRKEGRL